LYQDFCCTLTQMRVLAAATFDQINVVAAAANQSNFMVGSSFASPVVQPVCQRDARATIARPRLPRSRGGGSHDTAVSEVGRSQAASYGTSMSGQP
jgi:hypothetical protein